MNMQMYNPPKGALHDDVRIRMTKPAVRRLIARLRAEFKIPTNGFTSHSEVISFLKELQKKSWGKIEVLFKEGELFFGKIKDVQAKKKVDAALANRIPRQRFDSLIDDIRQEAKVRKFLVDHVTYIVLRGDAAANPLDYSFDSSLALNFFKFSYKVTLNQLKEINEGVTVKIFAPLRKEEWVALKHEVDNKLRSEFPELERRPYLQKGIEKNLKIAKGRTVHESYDAVHGGVDITENKKWLETIKKQKQRLKKRKGT